VVGQKDKQLHDAAADAFLQREHNSARKVQLAELRRQQAKKEAKQAQKDAKEANTSKVLKAAMYAAQQERDKQEEKTREAEADAYIQREQNAAKTYADY